MPYSVLVKEAYNLIDEIPQDKLEYVIQILRGANGLYSRSAEKTDTSNSLKAFDELTKIEPRLDKNFNYKEELSNSLEEKYGSIV